MNTITKSAADILTPMERSFLEAKASGMSNKMSLKKAGYKVNTNHERVINSILSRPRVAKEWDRIKKKTRRKMEMSRERVQKMVLEAFDVARNNEDPSAMVRAASEINKMCGFYAPEERVLSLSNDAKELQHQLAHMSEQDLLTLKGENEAIDADFELVSDERIIDTLGTS